MSTDTYDGPVVYQDGWHYSVDANDQPDQKLYLDDDGSYRVASEDDESWHDRKHQRFATVEMEDGAPGVRVTEEELAAVQEVLRRMRERGDS